MIITKTIEIDMGHRVPNHKSKCRNPHGHRYKIEVAVDDKVITDKGSSSEGMVIDFGDLKEIMMDILDTGFDHGYMIFKEDPYVSYYEKMKEDGLKIIIVDFIPTAENISEFWAHLLRIALEMKDIKLKYVKVWETPTSTAEYHF